MEPVQHSRPKKECMACIHYKTQKHTIDNINNVYSGKLYVIKGQVYAVEGHYFTESKSDLYLI